jgi:hypothetical protein
MLQADALWKMNRAIDEEIAAVQRWGTPVIAEAGAAAPTAGQTNAAGSAPSSGRASTFSQTNTQVAGVDEADIVKTDGKYVYLLHGGAFEIVDAWPAPSLALAGSLAIEGDPIEMYVANGQAVVYSTVDGAPIYQAAGLAPRPEYDDWYGDFYGGYGGGAGVAVARGAPSAVAPGWYGGWGYWYAHPLTKITVLTLNGAQATVARELYFEGYYESSRRMDTKVRTVLIGGAHGPVVQYWPFFDGSSSSPTTPQQWIAALESLRVQNAQAIHGSQITDWLPYAMVKTAGGVQAQTVACGDYYVPAQGTSVHGLTQIQSIDLAAPDVAPHGAAIVADTDTIYANDSTMILATRAWEDPGDWYGYYWNATDAVPSSPVTMDHTHVHMFDLTTDPTTPSYVASGTVPGTVKDQFSLDVAGNVLRMATTEEQWGQNLGPNNQTWSTVNHVFALQPDGSSWLSMIGDAGPIAPGETLYSARFVDTKGYLSTYRQFDPLFVLDLSDPTNPNVLGSLTIPGFSDYMQPLDATHLLTIGRAPAPGSNEESALELSIFDVSNPVSPQRTAVYDFTGYQYGYSEAQYDHKAFTWFPDKKLLSFPFYAYQTSSMKSTAEVFTVDTSAGITHLGSVDHTALFGSNEQGYCSGYFDPWVRRGVFLDNVLVSISYAGVISSDTTNMSQPPIATLPLPAPYEPGYPSCGAP